MRNAVDFASDLACWLRSQVQRPNPRINLTNFQGDPVTKLMNQMANVTRLCLELIHMHCWLLCNREINYAGEGGLCPGRCNILSSPIIVRSYLIQQGLCNDVRLDHKWKQLFLRHQVLRGSSNMIHLSNTFTIKQK